MSQSSSANVSYYAQGNAAFTGKNFLEAEKCYTLSLEHEAAIAGSFAVLHSKRSTCYLTLAQHAKDANTRAKYLLVAESDAERAIAADPNYMQAYLRASAVARYKGRLSKAVQFLEAGLRLVPNNAKLDKELSTLQLGYQLEKIYPGNVARLVNLATNARLLREGSDEPLEACEELLEMGIPGCSRLLLPRYPGSFECYSECELQSQGIEEDEFGALTSVILGDGPRALATVIQMIKGNLEILKLKHFAVDDWQGWFDSRIYATKLLTALRKQAQATQHRSPLPAQARDDDCVLVELLGILDDADAHNNDDKKYLQPFHANLVETLMDWKADPRVLPAVRKAFMKDAVDLHHWGSWKEFLHEFKLPCAAAVDLELEVRTDVLARDREKWRSRMLMLTIRSSTNTSDCDSLETLSYTKCTNFYCVKIESAEQPFDLYCSLCVKVHYCSDNCAYLDTCAHERFCSFINTGLAQKPQKPLAQQHLESTAADMRCENCFATAMATEKDFPLCSGCNKVRFCSTFCEMYALHKGVHGKTCVQGTRK